MIGLWFSLAAGFAAPPYGGGESVAYTEGNYVVVGVGTIWGATESGDSAVEELR